MCNDSKTQAEGFLLKEYDSAITLTLHVDGLRSKLTGFYLTLTGIAITGFAIVLKNDENIKLIEDPELLVTTLLFIISIIGLITVVVVARLRYAQLEHFRIINNIRTYFLKKNYDLWNVVQLSQRTLPQPNLRSGTYLWTCMIMIVSTCLFIGGMVLIWYKYFDLTKRINLFLSVIFGIAFFVIENLIYFRLSKPRELLEYSKDYEPVFQIVHTENLSG